MARSERDELLSYINDAHKDAYGVRPYDFSSYKAMSIEDLRVEAERLSVAVGETIDRENAERAEAAARFEKRIQDIIDSGAGDRETAIRWDRDSYEDEMVREDDGYYLYLNGLSYDYLAFVEPEVA